MRRPFLALAAASSIVACAGLFGDASQCDGDGDCTRFGANVTCDLAEHVCRQGTVSTPDAPKDVVVDMQVADVPVDMNVDPQCLATNKPVGTIDADPIDAGGQGALAVTRSITLDCSKEWVVPARLFVRPPVTVTIQAGTTLRLQKGASIVVAPGARIVADGRAEAPIVLTSAEAMPAPGDHGGILLLGVAPRSSKGPFAGDPLLDYGGTNAEDSSGTLRYVRVEYGGVTLAGAGRRTTVDFVQVRKSEGACFTMQGGTVDTKHLVCQQPGGDFFAYADGYAGRGQFLFGQRAPASRAGIAADDASPTLYNVTLCGDVSAPGTGLVLKNAARADVAGAIVTGFGAAVDVIGVPGSPVELRGSIAFGNTTNPAFDETDTEDPASPLYDDDLGFDENAWFAEAARGNQTSDPKLGACFDAKAPNPTPATLIPVVRMPPFDGFFDPKASYVGAFRDPNDGWSKGPWTRYAED